MSALGLALGYVARGWSPVPVPYKTKKPTIPGWQRLRIKETDAPRYFNCGPLNVGVLLGPPSSGLTDVDLDCAEALAVAPYLLPKTDAIFGRASRPASHWLYTSSIAQSADTTVLNFDDPTLGKDESKIVELRIGGDETLFRSSCTASRRLRSILPSLWTVKAGLRPPPPAADGLDTACHPAIICHQAFDCKERLRCAQGPCQLFSLRHLCADSDNHPQEISNGRRGVVGPAGVPWPNDSGDLALSSAIDRRSARKRQFPKLSSRRARPP